MSTAVTSIINFINTEVDINLYPFQIDSEAQDNIGVVSFWGGNLQQSVVKYTTVTITYRDVNSKEAYEKVQKVIDFLNWKQDVDLPGLYVISLKATDLYPRHLGQDERRRYYYTANFYMLSGINEPLPYWPDGVYEDPII